MRRAKVTLILSIFVLALMAVLASAAQDKTVTGSGKVVMEERNVGDYNALSLSINADVTITAGEKFQCQVSAEDNILPLILTERSGNTLRITAREGFLPNKPVTIKLVVPLLTSVALSGSGRVQMTEVTRNNLALAVNGSGSISSVGMVEKLTAAINGAGKVQATDLDAKKATITINGSGRADVHVTESLQVVILGSGNVAYSGSPDEIRKVVNGSGKIVRK